jgi:ABC-2 type transport system permease protein
MSVFPGLGATIRYEATLALRQRVLWLSLLPLTALIMLLSGFPDGRNRTAESAVIGDTALLINFLGSLGIAIVLADRLAGQRKPGLRELFGAMPAGGWIRSVGVLLGPWLVASFPSALVLLTMGGWLTIATGDPTLSVAAVVGLLTIVVPGSLLLTVLANVAGMLLPSTVVRVLLVPLWYWATVLTPLIPVPTVARTVLSPLGDYQAAQWLDVAQAHQDGGWLHPAPGGLSGVAALGFTIAITALAFLIGHVILAESR